MIVAGAGRRMLSSYGSGLAEYPPKPAMRQRSTGKTGRARCAACGRQWVF